MQESKIQALDESSGAVARPGRKEAGVKTASSRTETCFEAGGGEELAPHNEVPDSLPQVKHGVVPGKLTRLLGGDLVTGRPGSWSGPAAATPSAVARSQPRS